MNHNFCKFDLDACQIGVSGGCQWGGGISTRQAVLYRANLRYNNPVNSSIQHLPLRLAFDWILPNVVADDLNLYHILPRY